MVEDATGGSELPFDVGARYRVREVLGSGAFGIVYRVFDERWGQEVALKTIRNVAPDRRQWLKSEYRSLRDIVHPNLVRLHELFVDGEHCFFTMDLVPNAMPFNRRLELDRSSTDADQRAAVRRICRAGVQLADALHTVHSFEKCHRDIKPTNILVTPSDLVVLVDFGLASPVARHRDLDTTRGALIGTFEYMAPERYEDAHALPASDWYGVGLVLYETLVGKLPYSGQPYQMLTAKQHPPPRAATIVPAVPKALDDLLDELLQPDPAKRPSGDDILAVLREHGHGTGPPVVAWRPRQGEAKPIFVAREHEMATLRRAFDTAGEGRFVAVDVVGPSGIGKTALVRRFLEDERERSDRAPLVLEGSCHPHESLPYKAFDAIVDDVVRYWICLDDDEAAALRPGEGVDALALLFPELRRVPVLGTSSTPYARRGDPRVLRQSGFQALRTVFDRLAAKQAVVLWVDDLQWADADSVALLEGVFGGDDPPGVKLVLSRRPDDETAQPALLDAIARTQRRGIAYRIDLGPFAPDTALSLARAITDRAGGTHAGTIETIVKEAAGVPYLVSELAHFATERGLMGSEQRLGTTAGALMTARLQSLSTSDRILVELAALSAAPLPPEVLLSAAGSIDRSRLRDMCVLRLLRWTGNGEEMALQIYHDRLREFAADALTADVKARHHLALVSAMEASHFGDAERMMAHAHAGGDRDRTRRHAMVAASRAEAALAFDQAARLYQIALDHTEEGRPRAALRELLADALANAGKSTAAAPEFERACTALVDENPDAREHCAFLRRRAGEQYLKAGHFDDGLRLMEAFLADAGVTLPKTGTRALLVSLRRRCWLYLRGFGFERRAPDAIPAEVRSRLDDLWAATTALSMMDPVRSDSVGLLHFLEALRAGHAAHVARSLGYEAAFAALIGGRVLRRKAQDLCRRNRDAIAEEGGPYEHAFYRLGAGSALFFNSEWREAASLCDSAASSFRKECRGAEYEAAVALVFSLQALGQAGRVSELVARIPEAIREADARGDLFAANNYRGGFHAMGRIAAGQIDAVQADLRKVVETWRPGFYQMHAYHRVFAGVAADLYEGDARAALARIEEDWPALKAGLFLRMELPAMELRWTRARAMLAAAREGSAANRRTLLGRVRTLAHAIERSTAAASRPHAALLQAGLAVATERPDEAIPLLRRALGGYTAADMAIHREVARWSLGQRVGGDERTALLREVRSWMQAEGVPEMGPLVSAVAPGLETRGGG